MTYDELKTAMTTIKTLGEFTEEEAKTRKLIKDFWFHTGVSQKFFLSLPEDEALKMWAKFVVERIAEVS